MARKTFLLETFLLKKNHEFVGLIMNIVGFLIIRQIKGERLSDGQDHGHFARIPLGAA